MQATKQVLTVPLIAILALAGCARPGPVYATHEKAGNTFAIKVVAQREVDEINPLMLGAYFTFYTRSRESTEWREIMKFRHDDPLPVGSDHLQVIDDRVGFAFAVWRLVSTSDGGSSWTVWDGWVSGACGAIRDVQISEDGKGRMTFQGTPTCGQRVTNDFGKTWVSVR